MITVHARPGQTKEHHGSIARRFVLTNASRAKKFLWDERTELR